MIVLPTSPPPRPAPRWALSFADLCLVLLGFLLLLQAHRADPGAIGAGLRKAFSGRADPSAEQAAAPLFAPGEAILLPIARAHFLAVGRAAAHARARVRIESLGNDGGARRFDAWELAAARAASIARTVQAGGLDPARIDVALDATAATSATAGQHIRLTVVEARR